MKQLIVFALMLCLGEVYGHSKKNDNLEIICDIPDNEASYPNFNMFVIKNLRYPLVAVEKNLQGSCKIQFIVHDNGKLSEFVVLEGVEGCLECDQEALRVLKKTRKWTPAMKDGKKVSSRHIEVIKFILK